VSSKFSFSLPATQKDFGESVGITNVKSSGRHFVDFVDTRSDGPSLVNLHFVIGIRQFEFELDASDCGLKKMKNVMLQINKLA
jgi:hypothetical protein